MGWEGMAFNGGETWQLNWRQSKNKTHNWNNLEMRRKPGFGRHDDFSLAKRVCLEAEVPFCFSQVPCGGGRARSRWDFPTRQSLTIIS